MRIFEISQQAQYVCVTGPSIDGKSLFLLLSVLSTCSFYSLTPFLFSYLNESLCLTCLADQENVLTVNVQKELVVISYGMIINNKNILFESLFSLDNDVVNKNI